MKTKPSWTRTGNITSWTTDGQAEPVTTMTAQMASSVAAAVASTATATFGTVQRRSERAVTIEAAVPSSAIPT